MAANFSMTTIDRSVDNAIIEETIIELENGNKAYIRTHNPHGFYRLSLEKGQLPEILKGNYTSRNLAESELRKYLADKGRPVLAVTN